MADRAATAADVTATQPVAARPTSPRPTGRPSASHPCAPWESVHTGTDRDAARTFYEDVHHAHELRFEDDGRPFHHRHRAVSSGRVSLRTSSVSAGWTAVLSPDRHYVLAWSVEGGTVLDADGPERTVMRPGVPVVYPTGRETRIVVRPGTEHSVHFAADFLEAVAVVGTDAAPRPLDLPVTASPARLGTLQEVVKAAAPALLDATTEGSARDALELMLAEAVLAAFRPVPDGRPAGPHAGTVERAKTFMHARFDRPLTAGEIAAAADCSVRTLQESFQRQEGVTPMAYLRDIRLEKARLGLELADPSAASVSDVATSCGFRHMGRFSGAYREEFGEYPGDTLRKRTRPAPPA